MIRTNIVKLSVIDAVAYRQRLKKGGAGIVVIREGTKQPGIASISKTSGEAIPADNTPKKLYPQEAFNEAIALTAGMPFKRQGGVQLKGKVAVEEPAEKEAANSRTIC
ncbi:MAG: hypothetical protein IJM24_11000 [Clostridia bacterium]|nr:hypothetical protein [Clostridia bacterium]